MSATHRGKASHISIRKNGAIRTARRLSSLHAAAGAAMAWGVAIVPAAGQRWIPPWERDPMDPFPNFHPSSVCVGRPTRLPPGGGPWTDSLVEAHWISPINGNWSNGALWSTNPTYPNNQNPPGTTYAALLDAPGSGYTVTLNTNPTVDRVVLQTGSLLVDSHTLTLTDRLDVMPGQLLHLFFGGISGGTLNIGASGTGLQLERESNTLNAVTINGNATLSDNISGATVTNGLTLNGTFTFRSRGGGLVFSGNQTLGNGEFFFDVASNPFGRSLAVANGSNVTFAPGVIAHGRDFAIQGPVGTGLLQNQGRISSDVAGITTILSGRVANSGTLEALNGGTLSIVDTSGPNTDWSSSGLLRAGPGSTLELGGRFSLAGSTFDTAAGTVRLTGALDNAGSTLALGASTGSWIFGGTAFSPASITGGAVTTTAQTALNVLNSSLPNRLTNVAFNGNLNLNSGALNVGGGSLLGSVVAASGTTLDLSGAWSLGAQVSATNATLNLGGQGALLPGFSLQRTGGSVNLTGILNNTGTILDLNAASGSWNFAGGTLVGGTLRLRDGATLSLGAGATGSLSEVTIDGELAVTGDNARLRVTGDLPAGTVRVSGAGAGVAFDDSAALGGAISYQGTAGIDARLGIEGNSTLTVAPGGLISGGRATLGGSLFMPGTSTLLNQGTIAADRAGQTLTIDGSVLNNQGLLRATNGGQLVVPSLNGNLGAATASGTGSTLTFGGAYTVNSTVDIMGGAVLNLNGSWTNSGVINLTDSTLNLGGTFSAANFGMINRSNSTVRVTGTWDNGGGIIAVSPATGPLILAGGTISGGTINTSGGVGVSTVANTTSALNGVTYNGNLNVAAGTLNSSNLGLTGAVGISGGATLALNGSWSISGPISLGAGSLNLGGTFTFASLANLTNTGGVVNITGSLSNPGAALPINNTTGSWGLLGGSITTGSVQFADNRSLTAAGGSLRTTAISGAGAIISTLPPGAPFRILPDGPTSGASLAIGPGTTLRGRGLEIGFATIGTVNDAVTNQGLISADVADANRPLRIMPRSFINQGTVESRNGGTLWIGFDAFTPTPPVTDWANSGLIDGVSGNIFLGGHTTTAGLGTIHRTSADVVFNGSLDNAGQTLSIGPELNLSYLGGIVQGGQVAFAPGFLPNVSSRFEGVSPFTGEFNVNGMTMVGGLSLAGIAHFPNNTAAMYFEGDQTIPSGTLSFDGASSFFRSIQGRGQTTLTVGPGATIRGGDGFIGRNFNTGASTTLVNQGLISANAAGTVLTVEAPFFSNQGIIEAITGGTLLIQNQDGTNNWSNSGLIRVSGGGTATLGGTLVMSGGSLANNGGIIDLKGVLSNQNSTFTIGGSSGDITLSRGRIWGGTVNGTGRFVVAPTGGGFATFDGATINVDTDVLGRFLRIQNGIALNGAIRTAGTGTPFIEFADAAASVGGSGVIALNGSGPGALHRLNMANAGSLTIESGVTVRGGNATIGDPTGIGPTNALINLGRISADANGQTLSIIPMNFTNQGVIEAINGGILNIAGTAPGVGNNSARHWASTGIIRTINSTLNLGGMFETASLAGLQRTGGTVQFEGILNNTGSVLSIDGAANSWLMNGGETLAVIRNGTVNLLNGGTFLTPAGHGMTLDGVVLNGDLSIDGRLNLFNAPRINGIVTVPAMGAISAGPANVGGGGIPVTIPQATVLLQGGSVASDNLVLDSGVTVHGYGQFRRNLGSSGGDNALLNRGLVSADTPGQTLQIEVAGQFTNQGVLEAANGGILKLGSAWTNSGLIRVDNGSLVLWGRFSTANMGTIQRTGGSVTLAGFMENTGSVLALNNTTGPWLVDGGYLKGGIVNITQGASMTFQGATSTLDGPTVNGDLLLAGSGVRVEARNLVLNGTARLSGPGSTLAFRFTNEFPSGTIWFDPAAGGSDRVLTGSVFSQLTIGQAATVHGGRGQIFTSSTATVINRGLISADALGETLSIYTERFQNEGTTQAINGGILQFIPPLAPHPVVLINSGTLAPGAAGLGVPGDFIQSADGLLRITFDAGGRGGLAITGRTDLAGTLGLLLADGFFPPVGARFQVLDFDPARLSGRFSSILLPALGPGWSWDTSALYSAGTIGVVPAPATVTLAGGGLVLIAGRRSRRRKEVLP